MLGSPILYRIMMFQLFGFYFNPGSVYLRGMRIVIFQLFGFYFNPRSG